MKPIDVLAHTLGIKEENKKENVTPTHKSIVLESVNGCPYSNHTPYMFTDSIRTRAYVCGRMFFFSVFLLCICEIRMMLIVRMYVRIVQNYSSRFFFYFTRISRVILPSHVNIAFK